MAVQFIQVAVSIVVARIAGPSVLGTVAFGLAFVSMWTFLSDVGIGTAHIKLVSEGQDEGQCISTFAALKTANTVLFVLVVIGVFLTQKYVLNVPFESVIHEYVIIILLVSVTIQQFLYIPLITFAAKTEQAKQDIPDILKTIVHQLIRFVVVLFGYRAVALALGNLIATLLIVPLILYLFKDYPRGRFNKKLAAQYLKLSLPIFFIGMSTKLVFHLDRVMLQYFTNSEQVGYYSAGYRIGGFVLLIANSIGLLFFPLFSKAAARGDFDYIKDKIGKFEKFSFIFIMPGVIFLSLYSDVIVKVLLGEQYLPSIPIMAYINIAMFVTVLNMPYGNVLTGMGFFNLAAVIYFVNLLCFAGLAFIFINPNLVGMGAVGAAAAVLVATVLLGIMLRIFAKKKAQYLDVFKGVKYLIFGIINYLIFLQIYIHFSDLYGIFFKAVFVLIYFITTYLSLFLLRMVSLEDIKSVRDVVSIKKMGTYIKDEIQKT